MCGLIDVTPTLLALAGLRSDARMQGSNIFSGKTSELYFAHTDPWMPQPQFAARTLAWKWIAQENSNLVYNIEIDPQEATNKKTVPDELQNAKTEAATLLESLSSHQASSPRPRTISDEECARLQLLGYVQCQ